MNIHDPKLHTGALATIGMAVLGIGGYSAHVGNEIIAGPAPIAASFRDFLATAPKHDIAIYCGPGCGDLADKIADEFDAAGWIEHVEPALTSSDGIGVTPGTSGAREMAAALGRAMEKPVVVAGDSSFGPWQIWIGRQSRKTLQEK